MWLLTLFLGAGVIYLVNYWVNSYFNDWKKRGIPFNASSSPFKMLFQFFFTKKGLTQILEDSYHRLKGHKFGGYFQMFTPGIMIRDPDLINQICIKDFQYFEDRSLPSEVSDLFTESLGSLIGDKWRTLRHKMTPTFTSGKLKIMFDPIKECSDESVKYINEKIGQDIEIRDFMFKYSINVIGNVSFGLKVDALNDKTEKDNEFLSISRSFFKPSFLLMMKFMITMTMPKIRKYIKFSMVDEKIDTFFKNLVADMIAHREKTGEVRNDFLQLMLDQKAKEQTGSYSTDESKGLTKPSKHHTEEPEDDELLEQLKNMQNGNTNYKIGKVFNDSCIVSQTFLFISAGSETVASAISYILFELAMNPDCQKRLQEEVDEAVSKHGITYNSVRNMTYMEQVMNESLRIHPPAAFTSRICTQNYQIPDTDIVIEKGTFIGIPVINLHNDPQYIANPKKFDPDRFEDPDSIHPGVFLPFGVGPRMCIAKRLAILEVKVLLAVLMHNFTVVQSPKTKLPLRIQKSSVFQHVEGGLWVQFQKRK